MRAAEKAFDAYTVIGLVIPGRYRKPLLSSQPDKSESASESLTSGTFSGQWRSGGPIGAENPAGAPDILPNSPEPGQHPGKLHLMVSMCAWTVYYTTCHRAPPDIRNATSLHDLRIQLCTWLGHPVRRPIGL